MVEHYYTESLTIDNWEVKISPTTEYGCFEYIGEHESQHAEGGLWFLDKSLIDYDGVYDLPKPVVKAIRKLGYHIAE